MKCSYCKNKGHNIRTCQVKRTNQLLRYMFVIDELNDYHNINRPNKQITSQKEK